MAKYETHKPTLNELDYPTQIDAFIDAVGTDMDTIDSKSYATVISPVVGNIAEMNSGGDLVDSGLTTTDVPQTSGALVNNQFLMADASGNIVDSGISRFGTVNQFASVNIAIVANTTAGPTAHGMNTKPYTVSLYLECTIIEHNYAVGNQVLISAADLGLIVDDNNYTLIMPTVLPVYQVPDKTSRILDTITPANWEYVIKGVKND